MLGTFEFVSSLPRSLYSRCMMPVLGQYNFNPVFTNMSGILRLIKSQRGKKDV
jgi:hypothetical protein